MLIGLGIQEVGEVCQQLANGYYVPGTVLDALCTSSHVTFTTILGGSSCSSLSTNEKNEAQSAQMIHFKSLS